jgi:hypothetical protein
MLGVSVFNSAMTFSLELKNTFFQNIIKESFVLENKTKIFLSFGGDKEVSFKG